MMTINKQNHPQPLKRFKILCVVTLLIIAVSYSPRIVNQLYGQYFYPSLSICLRYVSSRFGFAIGDVLYGGLIIYSLLCVVRFFRKKFNRQHPPIPNMIAIYQVINFLLILFIVFKLLWGINYSKTPIAQTLNIDKQTYNQQQLSKLAYLFINKVNKLQSQTTLTEKYTFTQIQQQAVASYQKMSLQNPFFTYHIPSIKPALESAMLCKMGIEGYYNPVSGEANLNIKLPKVLIPFVICHEISHQIGVAKEDEANLVGYLVASQSEDVNFQYSANYNMLRYILLELRLNKVKNYADIIHTISPEVKNDFKTEDDFWRKHNSQMQNISNLAFDQFLKFNNQKKGIKSYQDIVIWLFNYHKKELI